MSALAVMGMLGCAGDEPAISGIPEAPILAEAEADAERGGPEVSEEPPPAHREPATYEKAPGVLVDIYYLGGRGFRDSRDVVAEQLGSLVNFTDLAGGGGQELVYPRGTLRVVEDRIYMIRVPLPAPLRRTDALVQAGFPPQADRWIVLHREYRLNHQWGFRRIRMRRQDKYSELVTEIEAWRWVPGEHTNRR